MSPVIAWHNSSPRETLDPHISTRHKSQKSQRKVVLPVLCEPPNGYPQSRMHSNSDLYQKKLINPQLERAQLQHSRFHKSQPQLSEDKSRKLFNSGQSYPRWTEQIRQFPNIPTESWFPLNQDSWGGSQRAIPKNVAKQRHPLTKSHSQPSENEARQPTVKTRRQSTEQWFPSGKLTDRRLSQVWYPRNSASTQYSAPGPWVPLENPANFHSYYSSRDIPTDISHPDTTRLESAYDSWYKYYGDGLHYALDPPRTREVLNNLSLTPLHYVQAGTCRIPRASVRLPRKNSRRSVR